MVTWVTPLNDLTSFFISRVLIFIVTLVNISRQGVE